MAPSTLKIGKFLNDNIMFISSSSINFFDKIKKISDPEEVFIFNLATQFHFNAVPLILKVGILRKNDIVFILSNYIYFCDQIKKNFR